MAESTTNGYSCKHCKAMLRSLDEVPIHKCFVGKEVYLDSDNILFTTSQLSDETEEIFSESRRSETKENNLKQNAIWNRNSSLALLTLYESNLSMLDNPKKKTKIWVAISEGLKDLNIQMSSDQVRWKMNSLIKKYKECIDNNSKTGRGNMSFEFYKQMEEILGKEREASALHTVGSSLPSKRNSSPAIAIQNKRERTEDRDNDISEASISTGPTVKREKVDNLSEKRIRPGHGTGSSKPRAKFELEKQWLQHLLSAEEHRKHCKEKEETILKTKTEALQLRKRQLQIQEKQLDAKKVLAGNKLKAKERRHEEIMEMERLKCKLLEQLINDKKTARQDSDSE